MMDTETDSDDNWFENKDLAENYAKYRSYYDRTMYEDIIGFCNHQEDFQTILAVDVGEHDFFTSVIQWLLS